MTNTTVEIVVPDEVIGSVYGENGSNLVRLRQVNNLGLVYRHIIFCTPFSCLLAPRVNPCELVCVITNLIS